ncbi:MAG: 2-hydroxyacyl-CoA dehydratase [Clostridia bacterium]|nr:2-hydroxyacyl-CoA dehydratase [Clostridia bacterium]
MIKLNFDKTKHTAVGIDIGSTTVKIAVIKDGSLVFECYERHHSQVRQKTLEILKSLEELLKDDSLAVTISGSAGLGLANAAHIDFIQEVYATGKTVKYFAPDTDVTIELGGEDAKVIFFRGIPDSRMNGTCAGGTGAFIDQVASLLNVDNETLDKLSLNHTKIYPIASRCGVFAKTDIQPLINQGAKKEDLAASVYQAVVNQTISGLVQGYEIKGKVMFLGGPLYHCLGLRERFTETLNLSEENALFPEYGLVAVALGCALNSLKSRNLRSYNDLISGIEASLSSASEVKQLPALFESEDEYESFCRRHKIADVKRIDPKDYEGVAYLGIDCGSTTTKIVLITEENEMLYSYYGSNKGNPVEIIKNELEKIYNLCGDKIKIKSGAVTGYGEELIKCAFKLEGGIVETMAHFYAARHFNPEVDFILDIGGQDIKCFKIRNNAIDNIMLNEACSSGCGSFIETFAHLAGYDVKDFARLAVKADAPVDLGSRCTVFMNSSVKQAQKDGISVENISAGLSISVVKNALYKVIRAGKATELGQNIVVQGGTFLNDSVLRSFEKELGRTVTRPSIAGLMGAFGAALYAHRIANESSCVISYDELKEFSHSVKAINCNGCENHCNLTINTFKDGQKYISGNKCEKGAFSENKYKNLPNLYEFKRSLFDSLKSEDGTKGTIGLPRALGMYELAPLWHGIFTELGYKVIFSDFSTYQTYTKGQHTIPSDTVCYPAKLMHGHIMELIEKGADTIFYPSLTYNMDENTGDNCYNCPVVAYYSELLYANMKDLKKVNFLFPYININNKKEFASKLSEVFNIPRNKTRKAVEKGYKAYNEWMDKIRKEGKKAIEFAKDNNMTALILAGRPYHIDPEICHLIDKLANSLGFVVLSEDSVSQTNKKAAVNVLNQWTYHSRMYNAAEFTAENSFVQLVQLVSFGCGIDAITTDEIKSIIEKSGKIYTQLKIDEISNLGAVKIRLRSLIAALSERSAL